MIASASTQPPVSFDYQGPERAFLVDVREAVTAEGYGWNADIEQQTLTLGQSTCDALAPLTDPQARADAVSAMHPGGGESGDRVFRAATTAALTHLCP